MSIKKCKHCNLDFSGYTPSQKGGHTRFCKKNPDYDNNLLEHKNRNKGQIPWNKGLKNPYAESTNLKRGETVSKRHEEGKYEGSAKKAAKARITNGNHLHSNQAKQKIREAALKSKHRRLKKGTIEYKGILLDSSWEFELAKRLDDLGIEWIRPNPLLWIDEYGTEHNYFPDFYLPEYDKYLDPKNKYAIQVQESKLKVLLNQYDNIEIIDSLEGCKTYTI